jgi:hypothetical protein
LIVRQERIEHEEAGRVRFYGFACISFICIAEPISRCNIKTGRYSPNSYNVLFIQLLQLLVRKCQTRIGENGLLQKDASEAMQITFRGATARIQKLAEI